MLFSFLSKIRSALLVAGLLFAVGCAEESVETPAPETGTKVETEVEAEGESHAGRDHSAWWCKEHGVPEEECTRCSVSLVSNFKESGDWCEEHQRPDSQCFLCQPDLQAKFAARYEAKYGETPPEPTDP